MPEAKKKRLRSVEELTEAHEDLLFKQETGKIDAKTADGMNTTLKGVVYLQCKLKLDYVKLMIMAQIKKIDLPQNLLPTIEAKP